MLFIEQLGVNEVLLLVLSLGLDLEIGTTLNSLVVQPLMEGEREERKGKREGWERERH